MKTKIKKNHKRTYLIISAIVAVAVIAGLLTWLYASGRNTTPPTGTSQPDATKTTQEEGSDTDKSDKPNDTQSEGVPAGGSPEPTNASVVIVDASQYDSTFEVRSYVNSLEEGTCTYTFTRGSQKITKQTNTLMNGDTTSCSTLSVSISEFSTSGEWQLVIDYLSASKDVTGQVKKTIEIQKG